MPGAEAGSTILKTARSFPAPSANAPSRQMSGTEDSASSLDRSISGSIMTDRVNAPDSTEKPQPRNVTKKSRPKSP